MRSRDKSLEDMIKASEYKLQGEVVQESIEGILGKVCDRSRITNVVSTQGDVTVLSILTQRNAKEAYSGYGYLSYTSSAAKQNIQGMVNVSVCVYL